MKSKSKMDYYALERILKGCANHRRIEILLLLEREGACSLTDIARLLHVNFKTIAVHTTRLAFAKLIIKRYRGVEVLHSLSPRGKHILMFCRTLEYK